MEHFVAFPNTVKCEQETNMAAASMITCKICWIWRQMKPPIHYWQYSTVDLDCGDPDWIQIRGRAERPVDEPQMQNYAGLILKYLDLRKETRHQKQ